MSPSLSILPLGLKLSSTFVLNINQNVQFFTQKRLRFRSNAMNVIFWQVMQSSPHDEADSP